MEIFTQVNENKGLALALGYFDGVHSGHCTVIKSAVDFAHQNGKKSAVITFKEHPQVVLRGCAPEYISTETSRREKLAAIGVDFCYELDFSTLTGMNGEEYLNEILIKNFAPVSISTGFNHYFGAKKSGTPELLEEFSAKFGYKYFKLPPVVVNDEVVSSSLIREKLAQGLIREANLLLGYPWSVCGIVQKGAGLASKIGFQTANLQWPEGLLQPPFGAYSVLANGRKAVANFGIKPTFENLVSAPVLEVHIIDFNENIYDRPLNVEFLDFLRPEKKFESVEELISQIKRDIMLA